jgi:predicted small lipoprotein YifL
VGFVNKPRFGFGRLAALAGMIIIASTLAGCGRKGALDLPPTAAGPVPEQTAAGPGLGEQGDALTHSPAGAAPASPDAPARQPHASRKWLPLDFLLN